jgi:hypothetical protein
VLAAACGEPEVRYVERVVEKPVIQEKVVTVEVPVIQERLQTVTVEKPVIVEKGHHRRKAGDRREDRGEEGGGAGQDHGSGDD